MTRRVHIVALAARTPVGLCSEATAAAIRAGICRVAEHPYLIDPVGSRLCCGFDFQIDPDLMGSERVLALARPALREVAAKLSANRPVDSVLHGNPVSLFLTLPEPRPGLGERELVQVGSLLASTKLPELPVQVEALCNGHPGALAGLEAAQRAITLGECELCIVAGVDSYLDADALTWLSAERRLAHAEMRGGFAPGEGAAMVALASEAACAALGLRSLGCLVAARCEHGGPDPEETGPLGTSLTNVIRQVGARLCGRPGPVVIDDVYCDINGERSRTDDWGFALLRTAALFRDGSAYRSPVAACGDLGAATAALNVVLAVSAWERGYASGPRALIWGASWGGLRGAALLERTGVRS